MEMCNKVLLRIKLKKIKHIKQKLMIAGDKRRDRGRMTGSSFGKKKVTRFDHTVVLWA